MNKKERTGLHQREVFLFNDLLVITKILSKKKNNVTYTFRKNLSLSGLQVSTFKTQRESDPIRIHFIDFYITLVAYSYRPASCYSRVKSTRRCFPRTRAVG